MEQMGNVAEGIVGSGSGHGPRRAAVASAAPSGAARPGQEDLWSRWYADLKLATELDRSVRLWLDRRAGPEGGAGGAAARA